MSKRKPPRGPTGPETGSGTKNSADAKKSATGQPPSSPGKSTPQKQPPMTDGADGQDDNVKARTGRQPPVEHQWKPGQSGNKKGRKKGSKNRKTLVRAAQRKLHTMMRAGRPRKMLIDEIGLHNIAQDVKRGDRKAYLEWVEITDRFGDRNEAVASMQELLAEDQAILANLLARKKNTPPPSQEDA